ncbi:hypothetical protein AB0D08_13505 [Kitasatospora sp. NPDC048540]|uniref:hypothetical protein n=1 Tax=unclassified Kitasatospora TaxID=2633591 RepID=UPI0007C78C49|nr:hypothetical protein [Kitasatospora sp. MBT63]
MTPGNPHDAALRWLATATTDPDHSHRHWARSTAATLLVPAGRSWDLLSVPDTLGRPALDVLHRLDDLHRNPGRGPALAHTGRTGFLVPVGTASRWFGTGVKVAGPGLWTALPHPARPRPALHWLVPPDGSGRLVDPALLELALHDAAARCHRPRLHAADDSHRPAGHSAG